MSILIDLHSANGLLSGLSAYQLAPRIVSGSVPILAYGQWETELDCVSLTYGCSLHLMLSHLFRQLAHANISIKQ